MYPSWQQRPSKSPVHTGPMPHASWQMGMPFEKAHGAPISQQPPPTEQEVWPAAQVYIWRKSKFGAAVGRGAWARRSCWAFRRGKYERVRRKAKRSWECIVMYSYCFAIWESCFNRVAWLNPRNWISGDEAIMLYLRNRMAAWTLSSQLPANFISRIDPLAFQRIEAFVSHRADCTSKV